MYNTIILKKGYASLTKSEYSKFRKGDTISGIDVEPEELKRWNIEQKEEAEKELKNYKCSYKKYQACIDVEEYALEYCECDEEGEFLTGSDYDFAELKERYLTRDREAGNVIECFETLEEARKAVKWYEEQDKNDGTYTADFYEIYDAEKEEIV